MVIERRVAHPLLPFRILANRTRATSFVAMMLVPAAMFAMFYFLSQFVQNVMGFSPLKTGVAFLPFSAGIIVAATISSKLVERVDPRWLAGVGTAMAGAALFGFSRLPYDDSLGAASSVDAHYATDILPFIVLMSLGMGLTFVPLTLTAVHGVGARDSGIGSGRAEHHAAGRRRARPGHAVHGRGALHLRQGGLAGRPRRRRPRRPAARDPQQVAQHAAADRPRRLHRGRDPRVPHRRRDDLARHR